MLDLILRDHHQPLSQPHYLYKNLSLLQMLFEFRLKKFGEYYPI